MNIGFTGTQQGMTKEQKNSFYYAINFKNNISDGSEFHHGDCIGADEQAVDIVMNLEFTIVCHPPIKTVKRAFTPSDYQRPPKDYLVRNHDIVDETDILIATPKEETGEELRSGTWATVRYARKKGRKILIIRPSGKIESNE